MRKVTTRNFYNKNFKYKKKSSGCAKFNRLKYTEVVADKKISDELFERFMTLAEHLTLSNLDINVRPMTNTSVEIYFPPCKIYGQEN